MKPELHNSTYIMVHKVCHLSFNHSLELTRVVNWLLIAAFPYFWPEKRIRDFILDIVISCAPLHLWYHSIRVIITKVYRGLYTCLILVHSIKHHSASVSTSSVETKIILTRFIAIAVAVCIGTGVEDVMGKIVCGCSRSLLC